MKFGGLSPELARLIAAQIFVHASMSGVRLAAPLLALNNGHSPAAVGFLLALFSLTQVIFALPAGRYADKHGLKRPMGIAAIVASTGAALSCAFPVFPVLCLSALMTGAAAGGTQIALQRHVGRATHNTAELKQVFSWLAIGPALSNFLGSMLAGFLIDTWGYRAAFLALVFLPIISWLWVRNSQELPPVIRAAGDKHGTAWDLLREPLFRRLLIVNWLLASCWDVHTFVVPLLGHERGFSASAIGAILGAFAISAATVRVFVPFVLKNATEWKVIAFTMASTATLFVLYPFMHSALMMGMCSVCLGLVLGCNQPMVLSTLHQITPEARHGEAVALRVIAVNISSVGMPMLFGAVGAAVGISSLFWFVGAVVGAGTPLAFQLKFDKKS